MTKEEAVNLIFNVDDLPSHEIYTYDGLTRGDALIWKRPDGVLITRFALGGTLAYCTKQQEIIDISTHKIAGVDGWHVFLVKNPNKKESKMNEIVSDIRGFIKEHRSVIYTVAAIMLLDHFVFGGKFRERLHGMVERLLHNTEKKLK